MYVNSTTINDIVSAIKQQDITPNDTVLLMLAEANCPDLSDLVTQLNTLNVSFFGGIFPSLIDGTKKHDTGAVINILPTFEPPYIIEDLNTTQFSIPMLSDSIDYVPGYSMLVLVDGLTSNISLFLSRLYNAFGNSFNYIGGGAGSLSLQQQSCLFTNKGVFQDAAIICPIKQKSSLGVRHGWQKIRGPFVATQTSKNVIKQLNWQNAYDVYRYAVEQDAGLTFNNDNFFDIAKGYPFGMVKERAEAVVRDPIAVNEYGELICVGEVPENSVLDILKGSSNSLIGAAAQAIDDCIKNDEQIKNALVFDCISRVLFLEDDFNKELEAVQNTIEQKKRYHHTTRSINPRRNIFLWTRQNRIF